MELLNRVNKVNYVVPTGNFGNILAAYYAGRMGIPVGKLICVLMKIRFCMFFRSRI